MIIKALPVGPLATNCYILGCPKTKKALIVDPGGDPDIIKAELKESGLSPQLILNTHGHIDHIGAVEELKRDFKIRFGIHEKESAVLKSAPAASAMFGLDRIEVPAPDFFLKDGDEHTIGGLSVKVIATPGHTKGSVCFLCGDTLISGDTLFQGSIGRTDLPGGSLKEILSSIRTRLFVLPDDTNVFPGHGESTTIGSEKRYNPYVEEKMERV